MKHCKASIVVATVVAFGVPTRSMAENAVSRSGASIFQRSKREEHPQFSGLLDNRYQQWLDELAAQRYEHQVFLPAYGPGGTQNGGMGLHWRIGTATVEKEEPLLHLAFVTEISAPGDYDRGEDKDKFGWVAFGLAEAGGMKGADVVSYEWASNILTDAHVLDENAKPRVDVSQDWTLVQVTAERAVHAHGTPLLLLIVEVSRRLDTGDSQDRAILFDGEPHLPPHRIIGAWGPETTVSYHGPSRRVRETLRFFSEADRPNNNNNNNNNSSLTADDYDAAAGAAENQKKNETDSPAPDAGQLFHSRMKQEADGYMDLRQPPNFTIPTDSTDPNVTDMTDPYVTVCIALEDTHFPLDGEEGHIIGIEVLLYENSRPYIHHVNLHGSHRHVGDCTSRALYPFLLGWAPGGGIIELPPEAGIPVGGPNGVSRLDGGTSYRSFGVEFHYYNPQVRPNIRDETTLRVYYTSRLRPYNAGYFQLGDGLVSLEGQPIVPPPETTATATTTTAATAAHKAGDVGRHSFTCPSSCTDAYFERESVVVFQEALHMHAKGARMVNRQYDRSGQLRRQGHVDYWDFRQAGVLWLMQPSFEVFPGDYFETTCYYQGEGDATHDVFGLGSRQEMCFAILGYYPRQKIPLQMCGYSWIDPCSSSYEASFVEPRNDTTTHLDPLCMERQFGYTNETTLLDREKGPSERLSSKDENNRSELLLGTISAAVILILVLLLVGLWMSRRGQQALQKRTTDFQATD